MRSPRVAHEDLVDLLPRLDPEAKTLLRLRFGLTDEGRPLSLAEAAAVLDLPVAEVRRREQEALALLPG